MKYELFNEDFTTGVFEHLDEGSVALILTDLPYGTTECSWDDVIPFDKMWSAFDHCIAAKRAIVLNASQPLSSRLISSNIERYAYTWYWDKKFAGNFVQADKTPLRVMEEVLVFCEDSRTPVYYRQMEKREKPIKKGGHTKSEAIPIRGNTEHSKEWRESTRIYTDKCPTNYLEFSVRDRFRGKHPTQNPVALYEYLIKTYTKPGETVLDCCFGSGSSGVAAVKLDRNYIGFELDEKNFDAGADWIEECYRKDPKHMKTIL